MANIIPTLIACCLTASAQSAAAAERWICSYSGLPSETDRTSISFLVSDTVLTEWPYEVRYTILKNNEHALLAEYHYADYDPVLLQTSIYLMSVMINKATQQLTTTSMLAGENPTWQFGRCRRHDLDVRPSLAISKPVAAK